MKLPRYSLELLLAFGAGRHPHCMASPSVPSNVTTEEGSLLPDVLKGHSLPKPPEGVLKFQLAPAAVINLTANVGDIIEISLVGNPTTGYSWEDADRRWLASNGAGRERLLSLAATPEGSVGDGDEGQVLASKRADKTAPEILEYLVKVYKVNPHPIGYVGTGGIYYFYYQALRPGSCQLRFVYTRPWEHVPIPEQDYAGANVIVHNSTKEEGIVQLPEKEDGQVYVIS